MAKPNLSRRQAIKHGIAAGTVLAVGADRMAGIAWEHTLADNPEAALVANNPDSSAWTLVAGGLANDGIAIARCMQQTLRPHGSVVGVRYAQNNLDSEKLYTSIAEAKARHGLPDRTHMYLGSAALMYMAEPLTRLVQDDVIKPAHIFIDSSPTGPNDIKGIQGDLIKSYADIPLRYSRIFNAFNQENPPKLPSLNDRDPGVPYAALHAHHEAIRNADTITVGLHAEAIRSKQLRPGSLMVIGEAAESAHYLRSKNDPLIDTERAIPSARRALGNGIALREHVDPYRRPDSHAAGTEHPRLIGELLAQI